MLLSFMSYLSVTKFLLLATPTTVDSNLIALFFYCFFSIVSLTPPKNLDAGTMAVFVCAVDANPFDEKTVVWDMPDHNVGKPAR